VNRTRTSTEAGKAARQTRSGGLTCWRVASSAPRAEARRRRLVTPTQRSRLYRTWLAFDRDGDGLTRSRLLGVCPGTQTLGVRSTRTPRRSTTGNEDAVGGVPAHSRGPDFARGSREVARSVGNSSAPRHGCAILRKDDPNRRWQLKRPRSRMLRAPDVRDRWRRAEVPAPGRWLQGGRLPGLTPQYRVDD